MRGALRVGAAVVTAAVAGLAGCRGTQETGKAPAGVPQRDLTLETAATPGVQVASPIEFGRTPAEPRHVPRRARLAATRPSAAPAAAPLPDVAKVPMPAAAPVAPAPVSEGIAEAPRAAPAADPEPVGSGRELAPGTTVTVIPASSGPAIPPSDLPDLPTRAERGGIFGGGGSGMGGDCRGRGPGGVIGLRLRRIPG
jgi:hypothetical protein